MFSCALEPVKRSQSVSPAFCSSWPEQLHQARSTERRKVFEQSRTNVCLTQARPSRPSPQLHLPLNSPLPGSELTKEPFRWDQRLFALVLRLPGAAAAESEPLGSVPTDDSAITQMCEVTGGKRGCLRSRSQAWLLCCPLPYLSSAGKITSNRKR